MKKRICLILTVFLMLSFTSCGNEAPDVLIENTQGRCEQSVYVGSTTSLAVAPEGYYRLKNLTAGMYLTYISKDGVEETYLCGKPECSHVDEREMYAVEGCNAYLGDVLLGSIVCHNGYVYVLEYDSNTFNVTLVKISADGSVHERLMVVGQAAINGSFYKYVFADDHTIYMTNTEHMSEEHIASLDRIDLTNREMTSVYSYTGESANISYLKYLDGNVFFMQTQKVEEGIYYTYQLMRYNVSSGETISLVEDGIQSYTLGDDGLLFYYVAMEGLYRCNLQTMEPELIRECDEETMYAHLACDGTYVYLENLYNRLLYDADSEDKMFVCDLNGNLVNAIPALLIEREVCDEDYMFSHGYTENGECWRYIKKEDIADPDVTWTFVKQP